MQRQRNAAFLTAVLVLLLVSSACAFASDLFAGEPSVSASTPETAVQPEQPAPVQTEAAPAETQAPEVPAEEAQPEEPAAPAEQDQPGGSTAAPQCGEDTCFYENAFRLQRPVGASGRNTIYPTLRFGTYLRNLNNAYHGVSFINSTGTPVNAAAAGEVVFAGDDSQVPNAQYKNYYGSLVILEHDLAGFEAPVYTLYAHLSEILVDRGDQVEAGEEIGRVGNSGDISGSALHFEVRYGENFYAATRNPELWLATLPDESGAPTGGLAGRIVDADGNYVPVNNVVIERLGGPGQRALQTFYVKTYAEDRLKGQEPWGESFALGGLPAGQYQVTFYFGPDLVQREVPVEADKLTVVTIPVP